MTASSDDGYASGNSLGGGANTLDGGAGNDNLMLSADDSSGNASARAYANGAHFWWRR
ncbi:MAG: hypothetical protein QM496_12810 [Verrucomicrobiota bacterium]